MQLGVFPLDYASTMLQRRAAPSKGTCAVILMNALQLCETGPTLQRSLEVPPRSDWHHHIREGSVVESNST